MQSYHNNTDDQYLKDRDRLKGFKRRIHKYVHTDRGRMIRGATGGQIKRKRKKKKQKKNEKKVQKQATCFPTQYIR